MITNITTASRPGGHGSRQQILRAMVGQFRQVKQVGGQTAHQVAGAVFVVKVEAQLLQMLEQIRPDVSLHMDAEGVTVIGHDELQKAPQHIGPRHDAHNQEKGLIAAFRQQVIQRRPGHQGECQVHAGNQHRAADVQEKELFVVFEVVEKNRQGAFSLIVFCSHNSLLSTQIRSIIHRNRKRCKRNRLFSWLYFMVICCILCIE